MGDVRKWTRNAWVGPTEDRKRIYCIHSSLCMNPTHNGNPATSSHESGKAEQLELIVMVNDRLTSCLVHQDPESSLTSDSSDHDAPFSPCRRVRSSKRCVLDCGRSGRLSSVYAGFCLLLDDTACGFPNPISRLLLRQEVI